MILSHLSPFALSQSLTARLLGLTMIVFVISMGLAAIVPLNNYRMAWLEAHITAAHLASLSWTEIPAQKITPALRARLLKNADVMSIAITDYAAGDHTYIHQQDLPVATKNVHLKNKNLFNHLSDTAEILFSSEGGEIIKVIGASKTNPLRQIEILINDRALYQDMWIYIHSTMNQIFIAALIVSLFLFLTIRSLFIHPLEKISRNISDFQKDPENIKNIIVPHKNMSEIGDAMRALADMQMTVCQTLHQKAHLAGLGLAVSKINHDLRNILSGAQLFADRLAESDDPVVRRAMPRLISSLGRAVDLCTRILEYGRGEESNPQSHRMLLRPLVDEVGHVINLPQDETLHWINEVDRDFYIWADHQYIFRILLNLGRNAVQALQENKSDKSQNGHITISAHFSDGLANIKIRDNGPGLSLRARANLFTPFMGSTKKGGKSGGFGLGLPIARELARASGGDLTIEASRSGASFRLMVPVKPSEA